MAETEPCKYRTNQNCTTGDCTTCSIFREYDRKTTSIQPYWNGTIQIKEEATR